MKATLRSFSGMIVCLALLAINVSAARAAEKGSDTVRVGFSSMTGFFSTGEDGTRSGYGYDLLSLVKRYSNLHFEYTGYGKTMTELQDMLLAGEVDMVTGVRRTDSNKDKFEFSLPVGTHSLILNVLDTDYRFTPGNYRTYEGMSIGILETGGAPPQMDRFAREHGFRYRQVIYESIEELESALKSHEVDAIACTSLRRTSGEKTLDTFATEQFYTIVREGDDELLDTFNSALIQMNQYERSWQSALYGKNYTEPETASIIFTQTERDYIRKHSGDNGKIRISFDNAWAPFSSSINGEYVGIIPNLWDKIMEMTGMDYEPHSYEGTIIPDKDLQEGLTDIFLGYFSDSYLAESNGYVGSSPFIETGACFISRKANSRDEVIGVSAVNPTLNSMLKLESWQSIVTYESSEQVLRALRKGEIDKAFLYTLEADHLINKDLTGRFVTTRVPYIKIAFCAVAPDSGDHTLIGIVSKCINSLTDADINSIISSGLALRPEDFGILDYLRLHKGAATIAALLLLVMLMYLFMSFAKHRAGRLYRDSLEEKQALLEKTSAELKENLDIISNTDYGIWRIYKDAEGNNCMNLDDVLKRIFGIEEDLSPSETYTYYHSRLKENVNEIESDDYKSMWEGKMMSRTLEWMHPTKGRIYIHAGGKSYTQTDGRVIISGFCADVSEHRFQENRANRVINSLARSYKFINYISLQKDTFINYMINAEYTPEEIMLLKSGNATKALSYVCRKRVSPEFREEMTAFVDLATINSRARNRDVLINQYKNMEGLWHEWSYIVADRNEDGTINHMICAVRMIDDEKQAELRKQRIIEDNIAANKAKTLFLQNMSHEIRTPLNAIVGFSQLLSIPGMELTEKEREDYFGHIANNSELLTMLIDDILDISDEEHGNYRVILSDCNCNDVCRKALSSVEYRIPSGVSLRYTTDIPEDHLVRTDSKRVQQVLINYLTNACKHTSEGEIVLDSSMTVNPGKITFSVTDTGTGVPEDKMDTIFERFTKLDQFTQGSGLGLNICLMVAEKLGGKVYLDKTYHKGARFVFEIDDKAA